MPRTPEINPVHAVPPATAEDALEYLREHKGMSYQHMDALLAYVGDLKGVNAELLAALKRIVDGTGEPGELDQAEAAIALAEGDES